MAKTKDIKATEPVTLNILQQKKLNISEAAAALGMSRTTFNKWRAMGQLPKSLSIAGREFWLERDLELWIYDQNPHLRQKEELLRQAKVAVMKSREIARARGMKVVGDE